MGHLVSEMRYQLSIAPGICIANLSDYSDETQHFNVAIDESMVTFDFKEPVPFNSAKRLVEEYLRCSVIQASLESGQEVFEFTFVSGRIANGCDRITAGESSLTSTVTVTRPVAWKALRPSKGFAITPDVDTLWGRYRQYLRGEEPLASMAYFCYTVLTYGVPRVDAAKRLNVSEAVLRRLSELSSTRGDELSARKMVRSMRALSEQERNWLEKAVPQLILQCGRAAHGLPGTKITMADLPRLIEGENS